MILTIIIITSIVSAYAFRDYSIMSKLQFNAYRIVHNREWYRLFSHALLHGGWIHLIINMLVLYSFGNFVISAFGYVFQFMNANLLFILYYVFAVAISSLYSVRKHRNNVYYNAVGAAAPSITMFIERLDPISSAMVSASIITTLGSFFNSFIISSSDG
jgi:membrane associated rhomboid family serine protease